MDEEDIDIDIEGEITEPRHSRYILLILIVFIFSFFLNLFFLKKNQLALMNLQCHQWIFLISLNLHGFMKQ